MRIPKSHYVKELERVTLTQALFLKEASTEVKDNKSQNHLSRESCKDGFFMPSILQ
jgi:hypothetical protein